MITHPLLLGALALDLIAVGLAVVAAVRAHSVIGGRRGDGQAPAGAQLDRRDPLAARLATGVAAIGLLASALWLTTVANLLPEWVRGATCGSGVMKAMGEAGYRALWLRGGALFATGLWWLTARSNHRQPHPPLTLFAARLSLLATPLWLLAVGSAILAWLQLDPTRPVSCCSEAYGGGAGSGAAIRAWQWLDADVAVVLFVITGLVQLTWVMARARRWRATSRRFGLAFFLLAASIVLFGTVALRGSLAAYHHGLVDHHCLWCLFLRRSGASGYPLLLAVGLLLASGVAPYWLAVVAGRFPELAAAAAAAARRAAVWSGVATWVFIALAVGPALIHYARWGHWLAP